MFGKSAFGSAGGFGQQAQPTNSVFGQQPQQPQQSAFGGFGAAPQQQTTAFGQPNATAGAFGQPAQQPAFGATTTTGGFGSTGMGFGQAKPSAFGSTTTSAFGSAQPAATGGFGGFGSTSTTPAFGATNTQTTGGIFGQQRPATSAFGSTTTSAFGQPQQSTGFGSGLGAATPAFGQAAGGVNQGTAIADFSPTQDRDITTGVNNFFQTITAMPQYKNYSLEELRLQDYQQGRKTAGAAGTTGGAFGQAPATGAFGQAPATGAFGQAPATGAFGQAPATGAFGSTTTSAFGQTTPAFGSTTTNTGGIFGQQASTTPAFGQAPATGAFGQAPATGAFGQTATAGAFGAAASKPFSFGSTPAPATTGFGQTTTAFGQAPAAGAFGQTTTTPATGFGAFGQKPATTTTTGFGGFGSTGTAATGGFGATTGGFGAAASKPTTFSFGATAPATSTATGFGGFGATTTPAATGFGQTATSAPGLFGAAKPAAPNTSLFGNNTGAATGTTTGFGGFGTGATGATGTTGGLFGQKPATGSLGTTGGLFGNTGATTTGFGGFGQTNNQAGGTFNLPTQGGLTSFGTNPLQNGMQQQSLVATVDKNPYGNNPLFDLSKVSNTTNGSVSGPTAVALDGGRKNNSPHYPISPRVVSKIKLRGFSFTPAVKSSLKKSTTSSSLEGISDDAVLGAGAFAPRSNNKKLVFDENVDTANIGALVNNKNNDKRKFAFDPQLEYIAARDQAASKTITTTTTVSTTVTTIDDSVNVNQSSVENASFSTGPVAAAASVAKKNGYYISPSLETLAGMPKEGLKQVQNLVIGRTGFGEVRFSQPVDLSQVELQDIMGQLVVIEEKKVVVYPQEETKPPQGTQLNVHATIQLEQCFCTDKNTGAPIKDPSHPRFKLFKEKLQNRPGVEFVSYDDNTGVWVFKVAGF